jgi:hypothetical protein
MTDAGISVLVISSTVYNEIPSEPTVVVVPVFDNEPDTGFGVALLMTVFPGHRVWSASNQPLAQARFVGCVQVQQLTVAAQFPRQLGTIGGRTRRGDERHPFRDEQRLGIAIHRQLDHGREPIPDSSRAAAPRR